MLPLVFIESVTVKWIAFSKAIATATTRNKIKSLHEKNATKWKCGHRKYTLLRIANVIEPLHFTMSYLNERLLHFVQYTNKCCDSIIRIDFSCCFVALVLCSHIFKFADNFDAMIVLRSHSEITFTVLWKMCVFFSFLCHSFELIAIWEILIIIWNTHSFVQTSNVKW